MKRLACFCLAWVFMIAIAAAGQLEGPELYPGEQELYKRALDEGMVVSFDTGPNWANWGALFKAFHKRYPGVEMVYNDIGSAATVVALEKARRRPQADTAYYFAQSAVEAKNKGVVEPFKPTNFEALPPALRDPEGEWFVVHRLVVAFLVNRNLVATVPESWADLLKPEYKDAVVYLDPRTTGQGQVLTFAAAYGNGGSVDDPMPGVEYLGSLHEAGNILRVAPITQYASFLKGEIPVWIAYEGDGLKAKLRDGMEECAIVIPAEASASAPYAMSLVKNGPNPHAGRLWLNFVMSNVGQGIFLEGFVRPAVPGVAVPESLREHFPAAPQAVDLDIVASSKAKAEIDAGWARLVLDEYSVLINH